MTRVQRDLSFGAALLALSTQALACGASRAERDSGGGAAGSTGSFSSGGAAGRAASGGKGGSSGISGAGGALAGSGGAAGSMSGSGGEAAHGGSVAEAGASGAAGATGSEYDPCPAHGTACIVMPLGDSITDGYGSSGGGYRPELFHLALSVSKTITFVGSAENGPDTVDAVPFPKHHEGHSGFTIQQIRDSVVTWVQAARPHIITLMIGTNDMYTDLAAANAPTALGDLIDDILDTNADLLLVVARIVPSNSDDVDARIQAYNAAIPDVVTARAEAGKHIVMVDM
ncbi:MAG TPA: SGNH/GDSL hydrolase family protein, partial [Polyangiaceae bacterium]|nr:SGNH/GDSL hydrolase family protein [Polyangiaceae bacterium]